MKKHRYKVNEYSSGYSVTDIHTGKSHWLSDGVDALFTRTGRAMRPGSEYFRKAWEHSLNCHPEVTGEAYFGN